MRNEPSRFLCRGSASWWTTQVSDIMIRSSRMRNIIREDGTIQVSLLYPPWRYPGFRYYDSDPHEYVGKKSVKMESSRFLCCSIKCATQVSDIMTQIFTDVKVSFKRADSIN